MTGDKAGRRHNDAGEQWLMSIGAFSRRTRLPISTLRYYHAIGLLEPALVDDQTGYRYYSRDQLTTADLVGELRRLGVSPDVIGDITTERIPLDAALKAERRRLQTEIGQRERALARIDRMVDGDRAEHQVTIENLRARRVPTVEGKVSSDSATVGIRRLAVTLRKRLGDETIEGFGAIFDLNLETDPIVTVVFARTDHVPSTVEVAEIPCGRYAVTDHVGDYQFAAAYDSALGRIESDGRQATGPVIEEYAGTRDCPRTRIAIGVAP